VNAWGWPRKFCVLLIGFCLPAAAAPADVFEIGGPLAGMKLPLYKTRHGEPPGYPGCLRNPDGSFINSPEGQSPEWELYPGSVEHWRAYWFKYCPVRSFFDRQSQVQNFLAAQVPGIPKDLIEQYAEPVYWVARQGTVANTGKLNPPVPVVRCKVGDPVLKLDLGTLEPGPYAIRVIGAVETKDLRSFLKPIYVRVRISDAPAGGTREYRQRIPYNDEFYAVAEVYFHVPARQAYRAEVLVDRGSEADLLVHNISLDNALAGAELKRIKQRQLARKLAKPEGPYHEAQVGKRERLSAEARLKRDADIWNAFPPVNFQGNSREFFGYLRVPQGAAGKDLKDIDAEYGAWEPVELDSGGWERHIGVFGKSSETFNQLMVNRKLGLVYTLDDLAANRPLPDPYPYKDDGAGLYFAPADGNPEKGQVFAPVASAVTERLRSYMHRLESGGRFFLSGQNPDFAHDSAVALIRFAYDYPTIEFPRYLCFVTTDPGPYRRSILRRKQMECYWANYIRFLTAVECYDRLFDYIQGNEDLARSVGRFVPWVRTSDDVLKLLDAYLVQTVAKRVMRYQYYGDGRQPERMAELATLAANPDATRPWMDWLFSRTFYYPNPPSGVQDAMINGTDRDGRSPIGSYSYMIGEFSADKLAEKLEGYVESGGDPKFDLRDFRRYPKALAGLDFEIRVRTAGMHFPRLGSSSGPDKRYAAGFFPERARVGWAWTKAPRFAYILKHFAGRKDETDAEWAQIEAAAAQQARAPWMENCSRVLPGYAAFLESGVRHDDFRFRRSVMLRVGIGQGHHHEDTLDLQVHALGLPMTVDGGQRRDTVYSRPRDTRTKIHNTVVVDDHDWMGYSWTRTLSDIPGARYLCAQAAPLFGTRLFRRQVALVDVDEGAGAQPLAPAQCGPQPQDLPREITLPRCYVFDVFRVAGGKEHIYCFHATVGDVNGPQPKATLAAVTPIPKEAPSGDAALQRAVEFLGEHFNEKYYAVAPAQFDVTFPLLKERVNPAAKNAAGSEKYFLGPLYDKAAPDKFTRWHLLGTEGALVMKGDMHCLQYNYEIPCFYVRRSGEDVQSAFAAIVEPYADTPTIAGKRELPVTGNENDALRAVAVEVKTVKGNTDVCFADGRPDKVRLVQSAEPIQVAAEYAYVSTDAQGLRQAGLTGGSLLETAHVRLKPAVAQRTARVVKTDYLEKTVWIDQVWPAWKGRPRWVEIGTLPGSGSESYVTGYAVTSLRPEGPGQSAMTFLRGADYYRSTIKTVDPQKGLVTCLAAAPFAIMNLTGISRNFTATNEDMTRFWRADILPGDAADSAYPFKLSGDPVTEADFGRQRALRLWEYGPGDTVRQSTCVNVLRVASDMLQLDADVDVTLGLKAATVEISVDRKDWKPLTGNREGPWLIVAIPVQPDAVYLRVGR